MYARWGVFVAGVLVVTVLAMTITDLFDVWLPVWVAGLWVVPISWGVLLAGCGVALVRRTTDLFAPGRTNGADHVFLLCVLALGGAVFGGMLGLGLHDWLRLKLIQCASFGFGGYPPICTPWFEFSSWLAPLGAVSGVGVVWSAGLVLLNRHNGRRTTAHGGRRPNRNTA